MSKFVKWGIALAVVILAMGTAAVVFAQTPTPPTPAAPGTQQSSTYGQVFWNALAGKLGVSVDTLKQDVRDALKAVVAQKVKDGQMTQQQADQANANIDKLPLNGAPFGGRGHGRGGFGKGGDRFFMEGNVLQAAATKLGMTTQDLMTELRQGKTLADVAKEKNVNADDLKAAMVAAVNAQIDQAVTAGKLTQQQADQLKAQASQQIDLNKTFTRPGNGHFGGKGWFGGKGGQGPQTPATPQTPTTPQFSQ